MLVRRGPNLGTRGPEMPRRPAKTSSRLQLETSFDVTNAPHLITPPRRIGPGFTPQPRDKLEEDERIDDLDVGPVGALLLDLDTQVR